MGRKTIRLRGRLSSAVLFMLLCSLLSGCLQSSEPTGDIDFMFTLLNGEEKQLSEYYGKVIVLDLMGVRCPPCQQEMFELKKISENYSHDQVTIISINVWVSLGENAALVQELIDAFDEQVGIELDWIFGLDDASATIGNAYTQGGVPTIHIIDQNGNIYYSHYEYTDYSTIAAKIDELLT